MSDHHRSLLFVTTIAAITAALALTSTACNCKNKVQTAMDVQMERMDRDKAHYGAHMKDMADNAMLQDMSVEDFHFVPHTSELSGTGADRLDRMAVLLNTYGGTVRYETDLRDQELSKKRMDHVREYLTVAGCNMDRVEVKSMMSGGQMMSAREAIRMDERGTRPPVEAEQGKPPLAKTSAPTKAP
jgi:outer membrane protein OmpA-like peptidoglycan-associated protein